MCLEAERRGAGDHVVETIDLVNRADTRDMTLVALLRQAQQQWVAEHSLVVSAADTASGEKSAEGERKASQARRGWRGCPVVLTSGVPVMGLSVCFLRSSFPPCLPSLHPSTTAHPEITSL